jgi:hypothetical protein
MSLFVFFDYEGGVFFLDSFNLLYVNELSDSIYFLLLPVFEVNCCLFELCLLD